MERPLKVYGGCYDGKNRLVVASSTKKAAWEAVNAIGRISYNTWDQYTSETSNETELAVALAQPLTVFTRNATDWNGAFTVAVR